MNVLISAYACEPHCGSEPAIGWNLIRELSQSHSLTVITRANHQAVIEESGFDWVRQVEWVYVDAPPWLMWWKKGRRGVALYYLLWQGLAFLKARDLVNEGNFSLVHHSTFASIAPPSLLMRLGLPFTAGPLGGAEDPPEPYRRSLPFREKFGFSFRRWRRKAALFCTGGLKPYRRARGCLAATPQGAEMLQNAGAPVCRVSYQSGLQDSEVAKLRSFRKQGAKSEGPLRLMVASRMIRWKAVAVAIEAAALLQDGGIDFVLEITETGPEEENLRALVKERGLQERVKFLGRLPSHEDLLRKLAACDLLLHPAVTESFGQACLEALAVGVPVACLDWGGPGQIVDEKVGYLIKPGSREEMIESFAAACRDVAGSGASKVQASDEFLTRFAWSTIANDIRALWRDVMDQAE